MFKLVKHSQSKVEQLLFQIFNLSVEMAHISTLWRTGLITFVKSLGLDGKIDAIM